MITVSQLIERLQAFPPNLAVAMASDEEGNNFNLLYDVGLDTAADLELSAPGFSAVDTEVAVLWP